MEKPCEVCVAAGDAGASRQFRVDEASLDGIHPSFGHRGAHQDVSEAVEDQLGLPGEGVVGGGDQCVLLEGARMDILSQAFLVSIYILSVGGEFLEIGDKDSCESRFLPSGASPSSATLITAAWRSAAKQKQTASASFRCFWLSSWCGSPNYCFQSNGQAGAFPGRWGRWSIRCRCFPRRPRSSFRRRRSVLCSRTCRASIRGR